MKYIYTALVILAFIYNADAQSTTIGHSQNIGLSNFIGFNTNSTLLFLTNAVNRM